MPTGDSWGPAVPPIQPAAKPACRCGHSREMHDHYRSGTDCTLCNCPYWHVSRPLARSLARGVLWGFALYGALMLAFLVAGLLLQAR